MCILLLPEIDTKMESPTNYRMCKKYHHSHCHHLHHPIFSAKQTIFFLLQSAFIVRRHNAFICISVFPSTDAPILHLLSHLSEIIFLNWRCTCQWSYLDAQPISISFSAFELDLSINLRLSSLHQIEQIVRGEGVHQLCHVIYPPKLSRAP